MIYRFKDEISSVKMDYIIFFRQNEVEIDTSAYVRVWIKHHCSNTFNIRNQIIDWENIDNQMISVKCQEYCDKIQKLRVFA